MADEPNWAGDGVFVIGVVVASGRNECFVAEIRNGKIMVVGTAGHGLTPGTVIVRDAEVELPDVPLGERGFGV